MARKKARSAAQKRNDARLGRMAKARARKAPRRTVKRRKTRKTNKPRKRSRSVVKRRAPSRRKSGFGSKIPLINNPIFRKAATGIGIATLGAAAIAIVAPSVAANPIVKPALAVLGGGLPGLAAQVFTQGGLGGLSNIFGGNGNGATGGGAGNQGFA